MNHRLILTWTFFSFMTLFFILIIFFLGLALDWLLDPSPSPSRLGWINNLNSRECNGQFPRNNQRLNLWLTPPVGGFDVHLPAALARQNLSFAFFSCFFLLVIAKMITRNLNKDDSKIKNYILWIEAVMIINSKNFKYKTKIWNQCLG